MANAKLFGGTRIDLIQNDTPLTEPDPGLVAFRLDSAGVVHVKANGGDEHAVGGGENDGRAVVAVGTLPAASAANAGVLKATSDGGTGGIPALMYSNGTAWIVAAE